MNPRYLKFRLVRLVRRIRRRLALLRRRADDYAAEHLWGKWQQLLLVRRFLVAWSLLAIISAWGLLWQAQQLTNFYTVAISAGGGRYIEAEVGRVNIINPVLPESGPAADAARLIFSGLTQYDGGGRVVADLATDWSVSPDGRTYTFNLRHGVKWHDGVPFTAQDVVFTLAAIQNPDSRSPLASSWQGVKAEAKSDYEVVFTLPNANAAFIDFTTVGIVPRHLLEGVDPTKLRVADFNQHPVGTGPFQLQAFLIRARQIELVANPHYYAGRPRLDGFTFRFYDTPAQVLDAYDRREVTGLAEVTPAELVRAGALPGLRTYNLSLPSETALFLRTTSPLLQDAGVRQALERATDRTAITTGPLQGLAVPLSLPLLPGQLGYNPSYNPPGFNPAAAAALLDAAGWQRSGRGERSKDGRPLRLTLVTRTGALEATARLVAMQWAKLGVGVTVKAVDLTTLEQSYIRPRAYDVLLFGIDIGADPDVYAYWHSSQVADPGLNLAEYQSSPTDRALESARVKTDAGVRAAKYAAFLSAWSGDYPAIVLYQPQYIYAAAATVQGINVTRLITPADRFYGVQDWTVLTQRRPIGQ